MFFILIIPGVLAMILMSYGIRKLRNRGRKSPFNEKLLREPGHSLDRVRDDLTIDALLYLFGVFTVPFILFTSYSLADRNLNPTLFFVIGSIAIAFCLLKAITKFNKVLMLHQGVEAEIATGQELSLLMRDGAWVFHDIPYQYGNIDHIIISIGGIFAVETKGYSKPESSDIETGNEAALKIVGDLLITPAGKTKKPVQQALVHASWLHSEIQRRFSISVPVRAVLAFPGWRVEGAFDQDCWIINPKRGNALRHAVTQQKIDDKNVQMIASWIEDLARSVVPKSKKFDSVKKKLFSSKSE